jgi:hypothetical protein
LDEARAASVKVSAASACEMSNDVQLREMREYNAASVRATLSSALPIYTHASQSAVRHA